MKIIGFKIIFVIDMFNFYIKWGYILIVVVCNYLENFIDIFLWRWL